MEYEFTVKYDKEIVNRTYFKFWKKNYAFDTSLSLALLAAASYLLFIEEITDWYIVFFFTVALFFTAMVFGAYFMWRKQAMTALKEMKIPEAKWKLNDKSLYIESNAGKAEVPWSAIKKIWGFEQAWLLFYANGAFSTLPIGGLDNETLDFIKDRVFENSGKVWQYS